MKTIETETLTLNQTGGHSPWGRIQTVRSVSREIEFVSTASHGGYWLGPDQWVELMDEFPTFDAFAGAPWLEEDCDGTLAILLWPQLFERRQVWSAVRLCQQHAEGSHALMLAHRWLGAGGNRAMKVVGMANAWEAANSNTWLQGGGCSTADGRWTSEWVRVGTGERRLLTTRNIPTDMEISGEQLDAMMVASRRVKRHA